MLRLALTCTLLGFAPLLGPFWSVRADEGPSGASGYVKIKVEVELRGVLSCTEKAVTVSIDKENKWVLDFGNEKELRAKAKDLNGKTVLVEGSATLRYKTKTVTQARRDDRRDNRNDPDLTMSVWDAEPKVAVKSLVAATK